MFNWSAYDNSQGGGGNGGGYGYPMGGAYPVATYPMAPAYPCNTGGTGLFGGATGGAFVGGLAGSLIGDAFFPGGGRGGRGGEKETVIQVNDNGGRKGGCGGGSYGDWEIMEQISDVRRDVACMPYMYQNTALQQTIANNAQLSALQMQLCQCCDETHVIELEGQYKALLTAAGISKDMAECCCKELDAIKCMGYETQLRDQANYGNIVKEMGEIKCLIKDTEKDGIIRAQAEKLCEYAGKVNTAEIIAAMKPACPIPAYAAASPYDSFTPTVKVAQPCNCGCDNRWSFNNCRN